MHDSQSKEVKRTAARLKMTRASKVADALRQSILNGELTPGSKVSLDQLREEHRVSLSPMREAISRLVNVGLVEFEDQRGYRIAPVSTANLREITKLRALLVCQALTECIATADLDWESDVLSALHRLNRINCDLSAPETLEDWEAAHSRFHMSLIAGCGMPMLLDFCHTLHDLNDRYRRIYMGPDSADRAVNDEHAAIAKAAVARNTALATELLQAHIERTGNTLLGRMAARRQDAGDASP